MRADTGASRLRWLAALAWMGLIFCLSAQSNPPSLPSFAPDLQATAGHLSVYFVLALFYRWALDGAGARHNAWWALLLVACFGASDEFHQSFVPNRNPDVVDWVTDLVGASAALLAYRFLFTRYLSLRLRSR